MLNEPTEIDLAKSANEAISAFARLFPTLPRRATALHVGVVLEEAMEQGFTEEVLFEMVIQISKSRQTMGDNGVA